MEFLPLEMVEKIAEHMTARDLAACCAVSVRWREIFNEDSLWKPHCFHGRHELEYLKTAESRVHPVFMSPEDEDSSLDPIGEWRLYYMQENHIWNNWRGGKKLEEELKENNSFDEDWETKPGKDSMCVFVTNDLLLTSLGKRVLLWDLAQRPLYMRDPFSLLCDCGVDLCEVVGDKIICVQKTAVQVYSFNLSDMTVWCLDQIFFFEGTETLSLSQAEEFLSGNILSDYCCGVVMGNFFFGIFFNGKIHIWDLNQREKLEETKCPEKKGNVKYVMTVKNEQLLEYFVVILEGLTFTYWFHVFSVVRMNFLDFSVSLSCNVANKSCAICEKFLVIALDDEFSMYNYHSSQLVMTVPCWDGVDYTVGVTHLQDHFLLIAKRTIHILDTINLAVDSSILPLKELHEHFFDFNKIVCGRFLVTESGYCLYKKWGIRIMLNSSNITERMHFGSYIFYKVNKACTKVAVIYPRKRITVVSYW